MKPLAILRSIFIIAITFTLATSCRAQNSVEHLDSLVSKFVAKLKSEKVETICIYQTYFIGSKNYDVDCRYTNIFKSNYIFWRQHGKTFVTKKDNCFDYSTVKIKAADLWKFYLSNKAVIKKEEVLPFQGYNKKDSSIYTEIRDHSGHQNFKVLMENDSIAKFFDGFNLEITDGNGGVNINYDHNITLKATNFADLLANKINELEDNKLFKKKDR